jgi:3-hydroxyisobutyrate dehydrogenase-like beta-hydroxyacid dehydrogenase
MEVVMKESIGLIGVGLVGTALAENLLAAGYKVIGYDIDAAKCRHLEALGGVSASDPADVGRRCRYVVLSLMTTAIVREVVEGPGGLLQADPPPAYIIDTTTGDPDESAALAGRLAGRGVHYLDSTISGSSREIRQRQGLFMVGGDKVAFEACGPVLAAVTDRMLYAGPAGSGAKSKLTVNLVLGLNRLALAEALVFAERLGLEPRAALALLKQSYAYSRIMEGKGDKMVNNDFATDARLSQHRKDVALVLEYAKQLGLDLPLTARHLEVLDSAIAAGDGDLDNAAVIREIRRRSRHA